MTDTIITITGIVLGSNGLFALIQVLLTRHYSRIDSNEERWQRIEQTLASVAYTQLSNSIEKCLDQGYATPEQRHELKISFDAYRANGWNGDMDARLAKVYSLPTKKIMKKTS